MKLDNAILCVQHPEHYYSINVHRVKFKFKWRGKIETREKYVIGANGIDDDLSFESAALAVARSYGGKPVKILEVTFVDSAVVTGHMHELIVGQFKVDAR